jgi:hypothetical protein
MSKDELAWFLSPEVQDFCRRSIEGAERHPELGADFLRPLPPPGSAEGEAILPIRHVRFPDQPPMPPRSVIAVIAFLMLGGMASDIGLLADTLLGSMPANRAQIISILITAPTFAVALVIALLTVIFQDPRMDLPRTIAGYSARTLTGLAVFAAGRRQGPALFAEWTAHLAGEGQDAAGWPLIRLAAGFVVAGARCQGQDWADTAWKPAEVMLRSRFLSGLFTSTPTVTVAVEVLTHKGTMTLLTSLGAIFGTWTFLAGMIKAGREYRGVKPPPPKARQAGTGDQDS